MNREYLLKQVIENSKYVKINYDAIEKNITLFKKPESSNIVILEYLNLERFTNEQIARFFLILQSIDFCFWGNPKWEIEYKNKSFSGFYGITIALIRALDEGYDILDFNYLKDISEKDFELILSGSVKIPLFKERLDIVKNIAETSLNMLDGKVYDFVLKAKTDQELLDMIINTFNSFHDVSIYNENKIYFLKKASLLVYDLYTNLPEVRKNIKNTDNILVGADYKLPQVLRELKILEYNKELSNLIDDGIQIEHDSIMEIEIRANTVYVTNIIKNKLNEQNIEITSFETGTAIWLLSKREEFQNKPYHLCETIFY